MTTLSMITQDLALSAPPSRSSIEPRPRPETRERARPFDEALDDQRRQVSGGRKGDSEPAKPVSESAESTKRSPGEDQRASNVEREASSEQPQPRASDEQGGTADQSGRNAEGGTSGSESRGDGSAQGFAVVAQGAQDPAQELPPQHADAPGDPPARQMGPNGPPAAQSEDGAAMNTAEARGGPRTSAVIGDAAGQPANGAGSTKGAHSDGQAATARPDSQTVSIDVAQRDAGSEGFDNNDSKRRPAPQFARQASNAASASSTAPRPIENAAAREERVSPDALTQLRNLIEKVTAAGANTRRESQPLTPAGARAVQIESSLQVENLTGQQATTEVQMASRGSAPSPSLNLNNLPGLGMKADGADAILPARSTAEESLFSDRIVRGVSAMVNQRGGVMNMKLHPAELGSLRVQMSIVQGAVTAQFVASTVEAQMMLDRGMGVLRAALESHGLHVERISVTHAPADSSGTSMRQDAQDQQNQQGAGRDHDAGKGESRGRHDGERQNRHDRPGGDASDFSGFASAFGTSEDAETGGDS